MTNKRLHILVLGATGMLGNAITRFFQVLPYKVTAIVRSTEGIPTQFLQGDVSFVCEPDIMDAVSLTERFKILMPDIVINCIGVIKQSQVANDILNLVRINSVFPHVLASVCAEVDSRLIHISTDCVFSGGQGMYVEDSFADANDLYGRSKYLGEVDYPHSITLRTSIIGHELRSNRSLVDWFLSQEGRVDGYCKAIFSGMPTVELARIIQDYVIPNQGLRGLYHVSVDPVSKFDLLSMIASEYKKTIAIDRNDTFVIDRSLDSSKFRLVTGYKPNPWDQMIYEMHVFK